MKIIKQLALISALVPICQFSGAFASAPHASISSLPREIVDHIFTYLDTESLRKAAQVSKVFKAAACKVLKTEQMQAPLQAICDLDSSLSDGEYENAARIVLSNEHASTQSKLKALQLLLVLDISDPNHTINYCDQFITLWDKKDFPSKKDFAQRKVEYANILRGTARAIAEDRAANTQLKPLGVYNDYFIDSKILPNEETLSILKKYVK